MKDKKKGPNFLLHGFILMSLGSHILIFLNMAGIFEDKTVSCIELSLHQISGPAVHQMSKPATRVIPRPKMIKKDANASYIPRIRADKTRDRTHDSPEGRIRLPRLPDDMDVAAFLADRLEAQTPAESVEPHAAAVESPARDDSHTVQESVGTHEKKVEFTSAEAYFAMLNSRIQKFKNYPKAAESRHIEGNVKVEFAVLKDGSLSDVRIVKSSRYRILDEAAIETIKRASPFPGPPAVFFTPPVTMQINILFELV